jgi:hypothetical protein
LTISEVAPGAAGFLMGLAHWNKKVSNPWQNSCYGKIVKGYKTPNEVVKE